VTVNLVSTRPEEAAKVSRALRAKRRREREQLRTLSCSAVVNRIVHPTPTLASFRLSALFTPTRGSDRPIPGFGPVRFEQALMFLRWQGADWVDPQKRLRDLTVSQRRFLAQAIMDAAPRPWRES
jgi:hypothetical protein